MSRRLLGTLIIATLLFALVPAAAFAASADDFPPGVVLPAPAGSTSGTLLSPSSDTDDWFRIHLDEGDQLTLSLRGASGTDFSLSLFSDKVGTVSEIDDLFRLWFWSGGYPRETSYVVPPSRDGTYSVLVHATDGQGGAGSYTLTWARLHDEPAVRLYGMDRYQTSAAVSRSTFVTATTAVIASGEKFPDALSASGLAGVLHAPVLLTRKAYVPEDVMRELQRLGVTTVYIIGSEDSVSLSAEQMLSGDPVGYDVERIGGGNRYETAQLVASQIALLGGSREVFLVTGLNYADALSVAPVAYARKMPVLLTRPTDIKPEALSALISLDTTHVIVAGSPASVSSAAATEAATECLINDSEDGTIDGNLLERWAGTDRYATAASVAESATALGWAGWDHVGIATGKNFPDALSGGAALGARCGVLLLTDPRFLSAAPKAAIEAHAADIGRAYLLGSASALTEQVRTDTKTALQP